MSEAAKTHNVSVVGAPNNSNGFTCRPGTAYNLGSTTTQTRLDWRRRAKS